MAPFLIYIPPLPPKKMVFMIRDFVKNGVLACFLIFPV